MGVDFIARFELQGERYFIHQVWHQTSFCLSITDGETVWKGIASKNLIKKSLAPSGLSCQKYVTLVKEGLSVQDTSEKRFSYKIKRDKKNTTCTLEWKIQLRSDTEIPGEVLPGAIRGQLKLRRIDLFCDTFDSKMSDDSDDDDDEEEGEREKGKSSMENVSSFLDLLVFQNDRLSSLASNLQKENDEFKAQKEMALSQLDQMILAKENLEGNLYDMFILLLNSKKEKCVYWRNQYNEMRREKGYTQSNEVHLKATRGGRGRGRGRGREKEREKGREKEKPKVREREVEEEFDPIEEEERQERKREDSPFDDIEVESEKEEREGKRKRKRGKEEKGKEEEEDGETDDEKKERKRRRTEPILSLESSAIIEEVGEEEEERGQEFGMSKSSLRSSGEGSPDTDFSLFDSFGETHTTVRRRVGRTTSKPLSEKEREKERKKERENPLRIGGIYERKSPFSSPSSRNSSSSSAGIRTPERDRSPNSLLNEDLSPFRQKGTPETPSPLTKRGSKEKRGESKEKYLQIPKPSPLLSPSSSPKSPKTKPTTTTTTTTETEAISSNEPVSLIRPRTRRREERGKYLTPTPTPTPLPLPTPPPSSRGGKEKEKEKERREKERAEREWREKAKRELERKERKDKERKELERERERKEREKKEREKKEKEKKEKEKKERERKERERKERERQEKEERSRRGGREKQRETRGKNKKMTKEEEKEEESDSLSSSIIPTNSPSPSPPTERKRRLRERGREKGRERKGDPSLSPLPQKAKSWRMELQFSESDSGVDTDELLGD